MLAGDRGGGVYPVTVITSPAGEAHGEFVLRIPSDELQAALGRIRSLNTEESLLAEFGARLFGALFGNDILSRYAESVGMAAARKGLRLHIQAPELAALPWELLYDPEKREFLGLSKRALITRYLHVPRPPSPLRAELPLRILVAIASPRDLPALDGEAELTRIQRALALPVEHGLIQFDVLPKTIKRALRDTLLTSYHVLHFIGYGAVNQGVESLAFEDNYGDLDPVDGRTLGTLLANTPVRLVVLNACQSAQRAHSEQSAQALAGVGPALVEAGIPAVVAMQFAVADDSAATFAQDFYGMLSRYVPVDECVARAREGLMLAAGAGSVDWATPVLFLRAPDGVIFVPEGVELARDEGRDQGVRQFQDLSVARPEPALPSASGPEQKQLIKHLWALVDYPAFKRRAEPSEEMSRWVARYQDCTWDDLERQDVSVVVENQPVTVILGEPGMGKTAILELLAFLHAERALRGEGDALVPVFVRLSQYAGEEDLVPLIRVGLNRHGQINLSPDHDDAQTRSLLSTRRFLILLDGLNQLPGDAAQRVHGLEVMRRFIEAHAQHKYVLTCRRSAYEDHPHWNAWIVLPHADQDVRAYLVRRLGEARGRHLYAGLPEHMRELARTPLILSLLLDELRARGDRAASQLGPLFTHFTSRMLDADEAAVPVEDKKALLAQLAFAMKWDRVPEYTVSNTLKLFGREARKAKMWGATPERMLDEVMASGVLRTGSTRRVAFSHPYCQDYFAALTLQEKFARGKVEWPALVKEPWWRESILFLASMVEQPAALIRELLPHDPLLAAECLLEAETADDTLQRQIGEALAEREKMGSSQEQEFATRLLIKLHAAGMVPDVATYRQVVDELIEASPMASHQPPEDSTAVAMSVRGYLLVPSGPLAGLRFPLLDGTADVGRSGEASITLQDSSISRRHAEFQATPEGVSIRDLGSTNGTRVNGKQITSWRKLQDGDEIQLGQVTIVFSVHKP
jgi:hypothetical protein